MPPDPSSARIAALLGSVPLTVTATVRAVVGRAGMLDLVFVIGDEDGTVPTAAVVDNVASSRGEMTARRCPARRVAGSTRSSGSNI